MTKAQNKSLEQLDRELTQATEQGQQEMAALRDQWKETEALIATTVEAHKAHHRPTYPANATDEINTLQASNRAVLEQLKAESAQLLLDARTSAAKSSADLNALAQSSPTQEISKDKTFEEMRIEINHLIEQNERALARAATSTNEQRLEKLSEGNLEPLEKLDNTTEKPPLPLPTWAIALLSATLGLAAGYLIWGLAR